MNFGKAIEAVKSGKTVRRSDWDAKVFVYLNPGSRDESKAGLKGYKRISQGLADKLFESAHKGTVTRLPNLNLKARSGSTITGWTPSQPDMLAEDWEIVE